MMVHPTAREARMEETHARSMICTRRERERERIATAETNIRHQRASESEGKTKSTYEKERMRIGDAHNSPTLPPKSFLSVGLSLSLSSSWIEVEGNIGLARVAR